MTRNPKHPTSIRLSDRSLSQLRELAALLETTQSNALARAIEEAWNKENEMFGKKTPYERAEARINRTPSLEPYRATFLYDWPEGDEHYRWVATAPVAELLDWAQTVEQPE